jgi:hypothetical protein
MKKKICSYDYGITKWKKYIEKPRIPSSDLSINQNLELKFAELENQIIP